MSTIVMVRPMSLSTWNVSLLSSFMNYGKIDRMYYFINFRYVLLREKNIILTEQRYAWEENVDYLSGEGIVVSLEHDIRKYRQ